MSPNTKSSVIVIYIVSIRHCDLYCDYNHYCDSPLFLGYYIFFHFTLLLTYAKAGYVCQLRAKINAFKGNKMTTAVLKHTNNYSIH